MEPKKPTLNIHRLSGAGKWVTVSVTTVAAIIGILVNARNLGLTPWLNFGAISFADMAARRVLLGAVTDTLRSIGDTLHLAATVTDEHGSTLAGATIIWSTDDSSVAVADSSGGVIARGPGSATIGATVRELHARTRVTVWQRVRSVAIAHDTLLRLPEGVSVQLVGRPLDGRGHSVRGRSVRWETADSSIVSVNTTGSAVAGAPGRTTLTASADGFSASVPAEVALTASTIRVVAGTDQRAPAGRKLPQPIQVQVFSRGGRPVPDALVSFTTEGSEGTAGPETSSTDRNGRARTSWTLGRHPGRQRLVVSVGAVDSTVSLVAEADPVVADTRVQAASDALSAAAGTLIADSVGIRVTDAAGAAAVDVPVSWAALDAGKIQPLGPRTDSAGLAWARWTLGPHSGTQRARVQVGNPRTMPSFTVTATALAETANAVALVSGGNQDGHVGIPLKKMVIAKLTDKNGNPVEGASVRVVPLSGSVVDSMPTANAQGEVHVSWTLGTRAGTQWIELVPGSGPKIRTSARALALEPANVTPGSLPQTSPAGRALTKPITVTVTDAYGNVIPDVQVLFSVTAGLAAPVRVMTDAKGQATTRWTLGPTAGEQSLTAAVRATAARSKVTVMAAGKASGVKPPKAAEKKAPEVKRPTTSRASGVPDASRRTAGPVTANRSPSPVTLGRNASLRADPTH